MKFDKDTVVIICAGPSLDRLTSKAWDAIKQAGQIVTVNGALASQSLHENNVQITLAAALDVGEGEGRGLQNKVPGFYDIWHKTSAWRFTLSGDGQPEGESFVHKAYEWSKKHDEGFVGGSTAIVVTNWLCNPWSKDPGDIAALEATKRRTNKVPPKRNVKRIYYFGLDMKKGHGIHARGSGNHISGFDDDMGRYNRVCKGWGKLYYHTNKQGVEVCNLTPGTALKTVPTKEIPSDWVVLIPETAS